MTDDASLRVIQQLGHTYRALLAAFEAGIGQSMPRWRLLLNIHQQGCVPQKQLAAHMRTDPAAVARQLKALERQGLVARTRDENDNRRVNVSLTAAGRQLVESTLPRRAEFVQNALIEFSVEEQRALEQALHRLEERLRGPS